MESEKITLITFFEGAKGLSMTCKSRSVSDHSENLSQQYFLKIYGFPTVNKISK